MNLLILLISYVCTFNISTPKTMKTLQVEKINQKVEEAVQIPALLDQYKVTFQTIGSVNWNTFPYRPMVQFRMAYTDQGLLLHYVVREEKTRAKYAKDGDPVWTDSCVEFFVIPGEGHYYNFECNCIGTLLLNGGKERKNRTDSPQTIKDKVKRWTSLPHQTFETPREEDEWQVALLIPYEAFFLENIVTLEGKTIRANFYKCGDELPTPHYVSWNPIESPKPNFHLPNFFGAVELKSSK